MRTQLILGLLATAAPLLAQGLTASQESRARSANYCRDPWVTFAIWSATGGTRNPNGVGNWGECDVQRYNGGRWRNYQELYQAVDQSLRQLSSQGYQERLTKRDGRSMALNAFANGQQLPCTLIFSGTTVVSPDGATVVAQGGGNLLNQDGSSVVAQGGGNLRLLSTTTKKVFTLPGNRVLIVGK